MFTDLGPRSLSDEVLLNEHSFEQQRFTIAIQLGVTEIMSFRQSTHASQYLVTGITPVLPECHVLYIPARRGRGHMPECLQGPPQE